MNYSSNNNKAEKQNQMNEKLIKELENSKKMKEYLDKNYPSLKDFEISNIIHSGSKSVIYKVSFPRKSHEEYIAMKCLLSNGNAEKELIISSQLKNNNITNVFRLKQSKEKSTFLMIMELYWMNLMDFQQNFLKRKILSESLMNFLTYQILKGLEHIYRCGFAHMDLKPQHLMVDKSLDIKLIDFYNSICYKKIINEKIKLNINGTNIYKSLEVLRKEVTNPRNLIKVDLYALGVILYDMGFGYYPYGLKHGEENNYDEILRKLEEEKLTFDEKMDFSPIFLDFLSRLLEKDINKRISLCDALNHQWVKGAAILLDEKEKTNNTDTFVKYLITDHLRPFNEYLKQCKII